MRLNPMWGVVTAFLLLLPVGASGQGGAPTAALKDTLFTADQASRGETLFLYTCSGCHGDYDLLSPSFSRTWEGRTLETLYTRIRETMPENDPGILTPEEGADLLAYLLSVQGYPSGSKPLPPADSILAAIKIHSPAEPEP